MRQASCLLESVPRFTERPVGGGERTRSFLDRSSMHVSRELVSTICQRSPHRSAIRAAARRFTRLSQPGSGRIARLEVEKEEERQGCTLDTSGGARCLPRGKRLGAAERRLELCPLRRRRDPVSESNLLPAGGRFLDSGRFEPKVPNFSRLYAIQIST